MAAFPSAAMTASRMLRSTAVAAAPMARRPLVATTLPAMRRFESSLTPAAGETAKPAAAAIFYPVPKRLMDGSEDTEVLSAAVLSGAPIELEARQVRIYKQTKPATQSGTWHGSHWRMDWDVLGKGHRWENPLIGWQSSGDAMQGTHINFHSKEDAIHFAQKQGYEYYVQEPQERKFRPKAYAEQFVYSPGKLKQVRTK